MGINIFSSSSCYEKPASSEPTQSPNPDPRRFVIGDYEQIGRNLVVCIRYPGCTTYEGNKILVFADLHILGLRACGVIDPHFTDVIPAHHVVPVARFEPTVRGWKLARVCASAL